MDKPQDRIVDSKELAIEIANLPKQAGFSTGYKGLDYYLRDVREGDLHILSGLTGEGKTAFGVSLTKNFSDAGLKCLWFSYEISTQELFERFGTPIPVFYLPRLMTSKSMDWIEKKIKEGVLNHDTKIVFVDHLHYLIDGPDVRNRNSAEILASMCRQFKMIARQHRIIIFVLCHMRKIKSDAHRPTIDDLKDSSGIAQEADSVLIVQRKGKRRSKKNNPDEISELSTDVNIWVDKNRRTGKLGCVEMEFDTDRIMHMEHDMGFE
jgi:replicative DNA helicase